MSAKLMGEVWGLQLDHPLQSIMLALADHAHDNGTSVYPSVGYLSWKTGYGERQVQRILKDLVASGLITPVANLKGGRGKATAYVIDMEKGVKKSPYISGGKGDKLPPLEANKKGDKLTEEDNKGDNSTLKGDKNDVKGDTTMSPEPYNPLEPPISISGDASHPALQTLTTLEELSLETVDRLPDYLRCAKTWNPEIWVALLRLTQMPLDMKPTKLQAIGLGEVAKTFTERGRTARDLEIFGQRWRQDIRGRDGTPPKPSQIRECWPQIMRKAEVTNGSGNGPSTVGAANNLMERQAQRREEQRRNSGGRSGAGQ